MKLQIPLTMGTEQINRMFQKLALNMKFEVIESEKNSSIIVYKEFCSLKNLLSFFLEGYLEETVTALKLEINLDERTCCREIIVKGLYGVII